MYVVDIQKSEAYNSCIMIKVYAAVYHGIHVLYNALVFIHKQIYCLSFTKFAGNDDEEWDERSSYSRRRHHPSSWYGEYGPPPPPPHPAYTAPNPWISPHRVPPIPSYDPRLLHTIGPDYPSYAIPQHSSSTPDHQRRHSSGDPNHPFTVPTLVIPAQTKESGQGDHVRSNLDRVTLQHSSPQGQSLTAPQQIPVTIQIQQSPTSTQHDRSPQPFTSMTESATKGESRLNTSDRSETVSTGVGTSPLQMPRNAHFDERGVPMLLDELGATKDKNQVVSICIGKYSVTSNS